MKEFVMSFKSEEELNEFFKLAQTVAASNLIGDDVRKLASTIVEHIVPTQGLYSLLEFELMKVPFTQVFGYCNENGLEKIYIWTKPSFRPDKHRQLYEDVTEYYEKKYPYLKFELTISTDIPEVYPEHIRVAPSDMFSPVRRKRQGKVNSNIKLQPKAKRQG